MKLRIPKNKVLVFAIRGKRKFHNLYMPQAGSVADYHDLQPIWIAQIGPDTITDDLHVGDMGYVLDSYEYEDLPKEVWERYRKEIPVESALAIVDEAQDSDGFITANLVHINSIVAKDEEESWRKQPRPEHQNLPSETRLSELAR